MIQKILQIYSNEINYLKLYSINPTPACGGGPSNWNCLLATIEPILPLASVKTLPFKTKDNDSSLLHETKWTGEEVEVEVEVADDEVEVVDDDEEEADETDEADEADEVELEAVVEEAWI
ncbi:hypothetical protein WICMUC_001504 [Wickerhamomyces mucosus]|uniref:Uncharacterized protein n=1 Tax=Wickerhamomyces mucosus TaxID=1378264 RepID=A0A9P8PUP5_9ASCO|nr:hypothetical protein WICMUC_001504 [Wickerhamomyces mucosus]